MFPNNTEILAQLEKLAAAQKSGEKVSHYSHTRTVVSCEADHIDFPALLAELKRLYRVEAAARGVGYAAREVYLIANDGEAKDMRGYVCMDALDIRLNALDAVLSEPAKESP